MNENAIAAVNDDLIDPTFPPELDPDNPDNYES
jgi:hypothetical protein